MDSATLFEDVLGRILDVTGANNDSALAKVLNIKPPSIAAAKKRKQIPPGWIVEISQKYDVTTDWLFFGIGEKRRSQTPMKIFPVDGEDYKKLDVTEIKMIPMVKSKLSAGNGSFEACEKIAAHFAFRMDFLKEQGDPSQMVLMTAAGQSQMPFIWDGDMVLIDKGQRDLRPGAMYAVGIEDLVYLKRIDTQPGKLILSSYNKDYPPFEVPTSEDTASLIRIMGRMIWSCHVW